MSNEAEGEVWKVDITLMYAEHLPFLSQTMEQKQQLAVPKAKHVKSLQELVNEQDKSK